MAFRFSQTRVFGIPWPGYRTFPELNLRCYVRHGNERGIVFIRELVQKRVVAWTGQTFYNEHFSVAPISWSVQEAADQRTVELGLSWKGEHYAISVTGQKPPVAAPTTGLVHFFKEPRWGFGTDRKGRPVCYDVVHPVWDIYPVRSYRVELDWNEVYGPQWKIMNGKSPCSVVLAAGSRVELYPRRRLTDEHRLRECPSSLHAVK